MLFFKMYARSYLIPNIAVNCDCGDLGNRKKTSVKVVINENPITEVRQCLGEYPSTFCNRIIFFKTMQISLFLEPAGSGRGLMSVPLGI